MKYYDFAVGRYDWNGIGCLISFNVGQYGVLSDIKPVYDENKDLSSFDEMARSCYNYSKLSLIEAEEKGIRFAFEGKFKSIF